MWSGFSHPSHKHRKLDIIQIKRRDTESASSGTDLDIGFCGTVEVGAACWGEGVFFREFTEFAALVLVAGGVEALEAAETVVGEHGDEFFRAGPAELVLERMGEDREAAGTKEGF